MRGPRSVARTLICEDLIYAAYMDGRLPDDHLAVHGHPLDVPGVGTSAAEVDRRSQPEVAVHDHILREGRVVLPVGGGDRHSLDGRALGTGPLDGDEAPGGATGRDPHHLARQGPTHVVLPSGSATVLVCKLGCHNVGPPIGSTNP